MAISPAVMELISRSSAPDVMGAYQRGKDIRFQGELRQQTMADLERKRLAEEEQARRTAQTRKTMGQVLSGQFAPGSQMQGLAVSDPEAAMKMSEFLGIPIDQPGRFKAMSDNVRVASALGSRNPEEAYRHIDNYTKRLNILGIETPRLDMWKLEYQRDPIEAVKDLNILNDSFMEIYGEKDTKTPEMKNYETALDSGYKGTFEEFIKIAKPTKSMQNLEAMGIKQDDPRYSEMMMLMEVGEQKKEEVFDPEVIDRLAKKYITTGKKPIDARGNKNNELNRLAIIRAQEMQAEKGISVSDTFFNVKDREALTGSIGQQEKNYGMMRSYISNLKSQVDKTKELMDDLKLRTDIRIFNKPIDYVKRKLSGNPELAKYGLYLGEIQTEITKITSGATGSVAEPSEGAREKWEGIIDGSMSVNDMESLLTEVSHAADLRLKSVEEALQATRARRSEIGEPQIKPEGPPKGTPYYKMVDGKLVKVGE